MASGNQMNNGICADLPMAPTNSISAMNVAVVSASPGDNGRNSAYVTVPKAKNVMKIATMKPQSPTRLVMNAFLPALAFSSFSNQNAMRKYEQAPTPSQPRNVSTKLSPRTRMSIEKTNRFRYVKKRGKRLSPCMYPIE